MRLGLRCVRRQHHGPLRAVTSDEGLRRVHVDDPAVIDDRHPIAETLGFLHEVPREEDRLAAVTDGARGGPARPPSTHPIVVVLPAPFGPIRPKFSPSRTSNDTSSTATVRRYAFRIPETSMTARLAVIGRRSRSTSPDECASVRLRH